MNRQQTAQLLRHRKVVEVLEEYQDETQQPAMAAFTNIATTFGEKVVLVSGVPAKRSSKGATEQKGLNRGGLTERLVKTANALYSLYRKEKNLEAARTLMITRSEYQRLDALSLQEQAEAVTKAATKRVADLSGYNLDAAAVQALAADAQAFNESIGGPKAAVEVNKVTGITMAQLLNDLNRYLKDDFRPATELLADTHPLLYARLREAMRVDDASYGRSAEAKARKAAKNAAKAASPDNGTTMPTA